MTVNEQKRKEKALDDMRLLIWQLVMEKGCDRRSLVCTPCGGNYGGVAHWVITVNGSPPRGMFIVTGDAGMMESVFFISGRKSKRLGAKQSRVVHRFCKEFIPGYDSYLAMNLAKTVRIPELEAA